MSLVPQVASHEGSALKRIGTVTFGGRFWRVGWLLPFAIPVVLVVLALVGGK